MPEEQKPISRCKVYIESITQHQFKAQTLNLRGIAADDELPENQRFNNASPSIEMKILVSNPVLKNAFRPGQRLYVDFTEAPDSPKE